MAFGHAPRFECSSQTSTRSPTLRLRWGCNHFCRRCRSGKYSFIHRRQNKSARSCTALQERRYSSAWKKTHREATTNPSCRKVATSVSRPKNRPENRSQALTDECSLSTPLQQGKCKATRQWEFFLSWETSRFSSLISPKFPFLYFNFRITDWQWRQNSTPWRPVVFASL